MYIVVVVVVVVVVIVYICIYSRTFKKWEKKLSFALLLAFCGCGVGIKLSKWLWFPYLRTLLNKIIVSKVSEWKMELLCFSIIVNMLKYKEIIIFLCMNLWFLKIYQNIFYTLQSMLKRNFAKVIYKHMGRWFKCL